ncbi:hypothetical protein J31TS3_44100 [Paenibacillus lactis]|nr:hypothetical protein J31TS3_44100 [Paenibacillus lactis]
MQRLSRANGQIRRQQRNRKPIRLTFQLARAEVGMLLKEKSADSLMEPIVTELMGADEALPLRRQLTMNDDKPAS